VVDILEYPCPSVPRP